MNVGPTDTENGSTKSNLYPASSTRTAESEAKKKAATFPTGSSTTTNTEVATATINTTSTASPTTATTLPAPSSATGTGTAIVDAKALTLPRVKITLDNVDSLDPTKLLKPELKRYHQLRRYQQMMKRANDAETQKRVDAAREAERWRNKEERDKKRMEIQEAIRKAQMARDRAPTASVFLSYKFGSGAMVSVNTGRLYCDTCFADIGCGMMRKLVA